MKAALIYPHQLFLDHPCVPGADLIFLVEDPLFFTQYAFHKQKLMLHRASMKRYQADLERSEATVRYVEAHEISHSSDIALILHKAGIREVSFCDLTDDWLERRLKKGLASHQILWNQESSPLFLCTLAEINEYQPDAKGVFFFTHFYVEQRKKRGLLIQNNKPVGGKWSFDSENREKLPKGLIIPTFELGEPSKPEAIEARKYISQYFSNNPGDDSALLYPFCHEAAERQLSQFIKERLRQFGPYEDAISEKEQFLFHSILTPALNCGLITPEKILSEVLGTEDVPLASLEGFVRQVAGWREFMRLIYLKRGRAQRTKNFLTHTRKIPSTFYDGTTGIVPVDVVIKRVLQNGYCHHIERLMILGNFMLLCDFHPDEVHRWFMELFIDSYDWVMVPNVYGMSQYADGGTMTTKPYISGSSFVLKMSDFKKGTWCEVWDGLYWRFIDQKYDLIKANPRMSVMSGMRDKLQQSGKLQVHLANANRFLNSMH